MRVEVWPTALLAFAGMGIVFCVLFVWSRWLWFKSLLPYCSPPFLALWLERADFEPPVAYSGCLLLRLQVWNIWSKRKTQGTLHCVVLGSQYPWLVCLLSTIQNFLGFMQCPGFSAVFFLGIIEERYLLCLPRGRSFLPVFCLGKNSE